MRKTGWRFWRETTLVLAALICLQWAPQISCADEIIYPALVAFSMDGCAPCAKMSPVIAELKSTQAPWLRVESINISRPENKVFSRHFGIKAVPSQVLVDRDGKAVSMMTGIVTQQKLLAALRECGVSSEKLPVRGSAMPMEKWILSIKVIPQQASPDVKTDTGLPRKGLYYRAYYIHEVERSGCSGVIESDCRSILCNIFGKDRLVFETVDMDDASNESILSKLSFSNNSDFARGICVVVKFMDAVPLKQVALDDLVTHKDDSESMESYINAALLELDR